MLNPPDCNSDGARNFAPSVTRRRSFSKDARSPIARTRLQSAGLTPLASEAVKPMRAKQCPVHLEACVTRMHELSGAGLQQLGRGIAAEVEVVRVHVASDFVIKDNYIDAAKWSADLQLSSLLQTGGARAGENISSGSVNGRASEPRTLNSINSLEDCNHANALYSLHH
jgi:hypothetical protein